MGMVNVIKETNTMLHETILNIENVMEILVGPRTEKRDVVAKAPECMMEDLSQVRDKAASLFEMSCQIKNLLQSEEIQTPTGGEGLREPRY